MLKRAVLIIAISSILQGCGRIDLETEKLPVFNPSVFQFRYGEFVAGSIQNQNSPVSGYKVQVSAGAFTSSIKQVSPNGYTAFSSIQGTAITDQ